MDDIKLDSTALQQLNSEQKALLDTIDNLRWLGVGHLIDLPQIIVVGDQSSGKSSVLEAISRVRFPARGGLCTRFATELVLRTAPQVRVDVKIEQQAAGGASGAPGSAAIPGPLQGFGETRFGKDDLPEIIEEAKRYMGVGESSTGFSEDVLRVEISGPDVPSLTLVDLPGFYHSEDSDQSWEGKHVVDRLVERYMQNKNSIILAIVSARNELILQKVLIKAKQHDPSHERTLGVITKPDTVVHGSGDEQRYIKLANNGESAYMLSLSWHVLRNRAENEAECSDEDRDAKESEFFKAGNWKSVLQKNRGIEDLRRKLSQVLVNHIKRSLPGLAQNIEAGIKERHLRLKQLGEPRSEPKQLRSYLIKIATRYHMTARDAIRGNYADEFFGDLYPAAGGSGHRDSRIRKLRGLVRDMNRAFDIVLSTKGARRAILREEDGSGGKSPDNSRALVGNPPYLKPFVDQFQFPDPQPVSWQDLNAELDDLAAINRGIEFPGSPNDKLALDLFRDQSKPWAEVARHHIQLVTDAAKAFVETLLAHIVDLDSDTRDAILRECVDPFFEERNRALDAKLQELLFHYKSGYAQPLEADFRARLSTRAKKRLIEQFKQLVYQAGPEAFNQWLEAGLLSGEELAARATAAETAENGISEFSTEKVIENMAAYYEMSVRTFTENVIVLAIENCLVCELPSLLTAEKVDEMNDEKLRELAAESVHVRMERDNLQREHDALQEGLRECRKYRLRGSTAINDAFREPPLASPKATAGFSEAIRPPPSTTLSPEATKAKAPPTTPVRSGKKNKRSAAANKTAGEEVASPVSTLPSLARSTASGGSSAQQVRSPPPGPETPPPQAAASPLTPGFSGKGQEPSGGKGSLFGAKEYYAYVEKAETSA